MTSDQIPEFVFGMTGLFHFTLETIKHPSSFITEKIEQYIGFILEVYIDGAIGDTGFTGNLRNGCFIVPLFRKDFYGSIEDLMIFIIIGVI
jgi:hypothetical protein